MDAVGPDQNVGLDFDIAAVGAAGETRHDLVGDLLEGGESMSRMNAVGADALDRALQQSHLQLAAMDGKLRKGIAGGASARFTPDFLSKLVEVGKRGGFYSFFREQLFEAKLAQLLAGMRQQVDAYAKRLDFVHRLEYFHLDAALMQHQAQGESADAGARNCNLHACLLE